MRCIARFDFRRRGALPSIAPDQPLATAMKRHENPLKGWQLDRATLTRTGHDLQRPECILCEPDGTVWTADARGVMRIDPDGADRKSTRLNSSHVALSSMPSSA